MPTFSYRTILLRTARTRKRATEQVLRRRENEDRGLLLTVVFGRLHAGARLRSRYDNALYSGWSLDGFKSRLHQLVVSARGFNTSPPISTN